MTAKPKNADKSKAPKNTPPATKAKKGASDSADVAAPVAAVAPAKPTKRVDKIALTAKLGEQFAAISATLSTTSQAKKLPRQLRWALKTLGMAEAAAIRAVTHAE